MHVNLTTKLAIHSVPRSGSTWLGEIFNSHPKVVYKFQPLFSYAFRDKLLPTSNKHEIDLFFEEISKSNDVFLNQTEARRLGKLPNFALKTNPNTVVYKEVRYHHILENMLSKNECVKAIGLVRNPMAVLNSWINAPREFRKDLGWNIKEEWQFAEKKNKNKIEEFNGYEKWKEVALMFLSLEKSFPNRFKLIEYDDLLSNSARFVEELFAFTGLSYSENTHRFISKSKLENNEDAYSVYKTQKVDDKWIGQLNSFIVDYIKNDLKHSVLERFIK